MKKTQRKDAIKNITRHLVAYFAVLSIITMGGTGFLTFKYTERGVFKTADIYYKKLLFRDFDLICSTGISEENIERLGQLEGIEDVEGVWNFDGKLRFDGKIFKVKCLTLTERVSVPNITKGELPVRADECALGRDFMRTNGIEVGDKIRLSVPSDTFKGALKSEEFTVTASMCHPNYVVNNEANIVLLPKEAYDTEALRGLYSNAYVLSDIPDKIGIFDNKYNKANDEINDRIRNLTEQFSEEYKINAQKNYDDAIEKIDGAIEDAEGKLSDAKTDAKKQLADGEEKIKESETELEEKTSEFLEKKEEGRKEIEAGEKTLNEEIKKGENEIRAAEDEMNRRLDEAHNLLEQKNDEFDRAEAQLNEAGEIIRNGEKELAESEEKLKEARAQLDDGWSKYESALDEACEIIDCLMDESGTESIQYGLDSLEEWLNDPATIEKYAITEEEKKDIDGVLERSRQIYEDNAQEVRTKEGIEKVTAAVELCKKLWTELSPIPERLCEEEEYQSLTKKYNEAIESGEKLPETYNTLLEKETEYKEKSDLYEEKKKELEDGKRIYEEKKGELENARIQLNNGWAQYYTQKAEAESQLAAAKTELDKKSREGKKKLEEGKKTYETSVAGAEKEIAEAEGKISDARNTLEEKRAEADEKISEGEKKLADSKIEAEEKKEQAADYLDDYGESAWFIFDRKTNTGYMQLWTSTQIVHRLGNILAPIFVLLAGAVCFSTLVLIVEEQKKQVGTVSAFGFFRKETCSKYLLFGLSATGIGIVSSIVLAFIAERVILSSFDKKQTFGSLMCVIEPKATIGMCVTALAVTLIATLMACNKFLRCSAIGLLNGTEPVKRSIRKKAGNTGAKGLYTRLIKNNMWLERERVLVSILIVMGSCMVVGIGFTFRNSFVDAVKKQETEVIVGDLIVTSDSALDEDMQNKISKVFEDLSTDYMPLTKEIHAYETEVETDFVTVYVVDADRINDFIHLVSYDSNKEIQPHDGSIVVTRKLYENQKLKKTNKLDIKDQQMRSCEFTVGDSIYNYLDNYIIMTPETYSDGYGKEPPLNAYFVNLNGTERKTVEDAVHRILPEADVVSANENIVTMQAMLKTYKVMAAGAVLLAVMMTFMITLNLANIQSNLRRKEIIIMRINGFSYKETLRYLLQETLVVNAAGIVLGIVIGVIACMIMVPSSEGYLYMQVRTPYVSAWLFAAGFCIVFAALIDGFVYNKVIHSNLTALYDN